jgi:8-oxo-dGTP diphosphatase
MTDHPIIVTAAVIEREGRFLLTCRPAGTHLAGFWEFPGGKCEEGETPEHCLERELREELDVQATAGHEIFRTRYTYPDRLIELRFLSCSFSGNPRPQQGQQMRWVARGDLPKLPFPPADRQFVEKLLGKRGRD